MGRTIDRKIMDRDYNKEIDDLLKDVVLPSDDEIKHDTHRAKNSLASKRRWQGAKGRERRQKQDAYNKSGKAKKFYEQRAEALRKERAHPFRLIFPDGTVRNFKGHHEALKEFGSENWNKGILPRTGAKRIERRRFKNCVIHRTDIMVDQKYVDKLVKEAYLKVNPPKKKRDNKAWAEKMEAWRKSKKGQRYLKNAPTKGTQNLKNARRIMTPKGEFASATQAVKAYGVNPCTIRDWLKRKPKEFYYTSERGG